MSGRGVGLHRGHTLLREGGHAGVSSDRGQGHERWMVVWVCSVRVSFCFASDTH
jgi:hypothetical protein